MENTRLQQVKEIFAEAMEKNAADRVAFIEQACKGDVALKKEVEAFLSAAERAGDFLNSPTHDSSPEGAKRLSEAPGTKIGPYKILELIGEGGFGSVFMAEQESPVRRRVALKIIKLGMDTKQVIARFEAERQALAMMEHPNIAKVFEAGATETGRPYFVMELVRGIPITDYCDHEKLNIRQRVELFIQVCQAIQHAHQKGIIHRDIKPSNVLVTIQDGKAVPKIIDFGIAKAVNQRLTEMTLFTEFRQFVGTPAYMSPEQAQMSDTEVDTRSDIYSLGVLLYELLTGTTPFDSKLLRSAAYDEIRRIIHEVDPPKPSTRLTGLGPVLTTVAQLRRSDPAKLLQGVRNELDWIAMKCLEKNPTRRYETAVALAQDIQRHLDNEPVLARPHTFFYRLRKTARRNKTLFAASGAVAVALIAGICVSTFEAVEASRARDSAETQRNEAFHANGRAEAEAKSLTRELSEHYATAGIAAWAKNDPALACLWFVRALKLDQGSPVRELAQRIRIASSLDRCARPLEPLTEGQPDFQAGLNELCRRRLHRDGTKAIITDRLGTKIISIETGAELTFWSILSRDGTRLITRDPWGKTRFWNAVTGEALTAPLDYGANRTYFYLSDDSRLAAVAPPGRTVEVWDAVAPKRLTQFDIGGAFDFATFSHGGARILTCNTDGVARVWESRTGKASGPAMHPLRAQIQWPETSLFYSSFSPDGRQVVLTSEDTAQIWDVETGQPITPPLEHNSELVLVSFSPDGNRLLTVGIDHLARVWNARTGQPVSTLGTQGEGWQQPQIAFAADSSRIVDTSQGLVRVWDVETGKVLSPPVRGGYLTLSSADAGRIVLYQAGRINAWEMNPLKPLTRAMKNIGGLLKASFTPDGQRIMMASQNGLRIWDANLGKPLIPFTDQIAASPIPDGKRIVSLTTENIVHLWQGANGQTLAPSSNHQTPANVEFSPDGHRMVIIGDDETARVWDANRNVPLAPVIRHSGIDRASFSSDGQRLLTSSTTNHTVRLWDVATGILIKAVSDRADSALFSRDGRQILLKGGDGLSVMNTVTGKEISLMPDQDAVGGFSPDGSRIAGGSDGMCIWDSASGTALTPTIAGARFLAFSPDGSQIIAARQSGSQIWDAATGEPLTPPGDVWNLAEFSPDGNRIIGAAGDTARIWTAPHPNKYSVDVLERLAEVLSFERIDDMGGVVQLTDREWNRRLNGLRMEIPDFFRRAPEPRNLTEVLPGYRAEVETLITGAATPIQRPLLARKLSVSSEWEREAGLFDQAIFLAQSAIRLDNSFLEAHEQLAMVYLSGGQYAQALAIYRQYAQSILPRTGEEHITFTAFGQRGLDEVKSLRERDGGNPELQTIEATMRASNNPIRALSEHELAEIIADASTEIDQSNDPVEKSRAYIRRAGLYEQLGDFSAALADHRRSVELNPSRITSWARQGYIQCYLGNFPAYREICRNMLERFSKDGLDEAAQTSKLCLIIPNSVKDMAGVMRLADAGASAAGYGLNTTFAMGKGMAEYRAGHFEPAVQWLQRATRDFIDTNDPAIYSLNMVNVAAKFYIAMARKRQGRDAEAQTLFLEAHHELATEIPTLQSHAPDVGGVRWILVQLADREASALIGIPARRSGTSQPVTMP